MIILLLNLFVEKNVFICCDEARKKNSIIFKGKRAETLRVQTVF